MFNPRLLALVPHSSKRIAAVVFYQWLALLCNIFIMQQLAALLTDLAKPLRQLEALTQNSGLLPSSVPKIGLIFLAVLIRSVLLRRAAHWSFAASSTVRLRLRQLLYDKLLRLGGHYQQILSSSELVQLSVEGVEQLESYFAAYLPQFFYALLAPLTLFAVLSQVHLGAALILLLGVPLIPITIAAVQTWAKKLLAKYWGRYTALGDSFLENLQGLVTLKIYQADAHKHEEMNRQAEEFRKITMRVLSMQLNSIGIMDLIAYGGSALGAILSTRALAAGQINLAGCLLIILLAAEYFLPMRMLGSYFHVAMNGMAASKKIFALLDTEENSKLEKQLPCPSKPAIQADKLSFAYDHEREILREISLEIPPCGLSAIVGPSGSGKSTLALLLAERLQGYRGSLTFSGCELRELSPASVRQHVCYLGHQSYLFKGSVRENLLLARSDATDEKLWQVLETVKLADFLKTQKGLDSQLLEQGSNWSGGQRQRLALARALLSPADVFILDEASSNIDIESENAILSAVQLLSQTHCVILIAHRLSSVRAAQKIFVLQHGSVLETGRADELLQQGGLFAELWQEQQSLENVGRENE